MPTTTFTPEKRTEIQNEINKVQEYYEDVRKIKQLSNDISYNEIVVNWNLQDVELKQNLIDVRNDIHDSFEKIFSNADFLGGIITKATKSVLPVEHIKSSQVFEACDFNNISKSKLKHIGSFELSKHSSHHV